MNFTPQFSSPGVAALPGFGAPQTAQNATRTANPTMMGPSYANSDTFSTHAPVNMSGPGLGSPAGAQQGGGQQAGFQNGLASIYQQKLGRAPDQSGLDFYNGLMQNQGYTQQQVADLIGGSQEAQQFAAPAQQAAPVQQAPQQQAGFENGLASIYNQQLGRRPDQAGFGFYNDLMQNQGYTEQQVADLIAASPEAQQYREFGPTANIFDQAQNWMNDAASRFGNNFSAPNIRSSNVTADKFTDVNIDDYMNPFTQKVTDVTMDELERQRLMAMNNTDAAAAGAFGGSRHGVMQAETNRGFGDVAARTLAGLNSGAYSNAQGAAFQDIGNKLSADVGNQSASLQAQLANAQNALSANSQNLQGASGLAQLSNMGFSRGQSALDAQMNAGNMQQALQQQLINAARQQTNNDTGFTDEALSRLLATMGGAKYGTSTTESSNPGLFGLLTPFL